MADDAGRLNEVLAEASFLYGGNADYIDDLYARYEADPKAVDAEWQSFFQSLKDDARDVAENARGPSWRRPGWPPPERNELAAALDGDWKRARDLHYRLFPLARAAFLETNPIPIKEAMAMAGMIEPEFRLPMCRMSDANREKLRAILKSYSLVK